MNKTKPIFEFLLWDNCRNDCKFCFQKQSNNLLTDDQKVLSINKAMDFLQSDKYVAGSHILLIGGEIFDSPKIFDRLFLLFDFVVDKMNSGDIDLFYINTNLIYKDLTGLSYLLNKIDQHGLWPRFKFTTSYDIEGRFKTVKVEQLMLNNLLAVKGKYPQVNIVVNTMLSKQACSKIIDGSFNVKQFCNQYQVDINLIPYIVLDDYLTAPRNQIFRALKVVNDLIPGYVTRYTNNFDIKQDKHLFKINKQTMEFEYCSCGESECGHSENFKRYSAKNSCFVCDLKAMFTLYE